MTKEKIVRKLFKNRFPNEQVLYNFRPQWLTNPETGYPLELDIYYPKLKLAIEINGLHHETNYQKYKDNIKEFRCKEKGITLESIWIKKHGLDQVIKKYNLNPEGKKIKFTPKTPKRKSKLYNYWINTTKIIKKESKLNRLEYAYRLQREESESNKRRKAMI